MAATVTVSQDVPFYHDVSQLEVIRVAIVGVVVGVLIPLVGWLIDQFVLRPIFCADPANGVCASATILGHYSAIVLVTAAAIPVMISWGIFRGLLVAVGAAVALWGLMRYIEPLTSSWVEYGLFSALLFGLAYLLFYWLMRLRNFGLSLVLAVVVIVAVRWALLV